MQPIVDGLEEQYAGQVAFYQLNARDGADGQAAYEYYALRGHPTIMIVEPGGAVSFQQSGVIPEATLTATLEAAIEE
jgi:hypothetical protein